MLGKLIGELLRRSQPKPAGSPLSNRERADLQRALNYAAAGKAGEAERIYHELLAAHPRHVDLLHLAGRAALERGRAHEAIELLARAAALEPGAAELELHLGQAFAASGAATHAVEHYGRAIKANPTFVPAYLSLGALLQRTREFDAAARAYRQALESCPDTAELHVGLASALRAAGKVDEALASADRALARQPDLADAHLQRGHALRELGRGPESIAAYREAVALRPAMPDAHLHLGNALYLEARDLDAAQNAYRRVLKLDPGSTEARFNLALMRLASGDYASGWADYELRRLDPDWYQRPAEYPQWNGGELTGKRLLVYSEQGLGDEIMFASCIPDLLSRNVECIIECLPKLEKLFKRSFPSAIVYPRAADRTVPGKIGAAGIDLEVPIGSLPQYFRATPEAFPRHTGYLRAEPELVAAWRRRLDALGPGLKVGLAWQGGTRKSRNAARSLALDQLAPVVQVENTHFIDLQYTNCTNEIEAFESRHGIRIQSWDAVRDDYAETAALVSALDLVISVCTAVIHLGGALGRPVWVMVPYGCEWRYGASGEQMPWYPSVRLLRQQRAGDWETVIDTVANSLRATVETRVS